MPDPEVDPPPQRLTHNPFAALRPGGERRSDLTPARAAGAPSAASARVTVRRERAGRGGKAVTIAEGPGLAGRAVAELARAAARALGTGARVEDGALVVQGDQAERLVAWLASRGFSSVARGN